MQTWCIERVSFLPNYEINGEIATLSQTNTGADRHITSILYRQSCPIPYAVDDFTRERQPRALGNRVKSPWWIIMSIRMDSATVYGVLHNLSWDKKDK